jgi:hypothetical protein
MPETGGVMSADYFARLPADTQMRLRQIAWKFLGIRVIPDQETALRVLALQDLHADVLQAYGDWLEHARRCVLDRGESWTPAALQQFAIEEAGC